MATGQSRYSGHCGLTRRRTVPSSRAALALAVSHASSAKACEVGLELGVTSLPRRLPTLGKCGKPRLYGAGAVYSSALQLSSSGQSLASNQRNQSRDQRQRPHGPTNSRLSQGRIRRSSPQRLSAGLHLLQDPPLLGVQCLIDA
ncbi:uncharacterized protein P174DRAFT_118021 [Aspergillus novofumigatus IBT 16806]|uniref:Uncharacterized protein n=1 Tax=Aspergillus novofumigatus (strain IBT 16806) TaxID=1392255 RepID=A0A2I1CJN2_ASPN1|nr:uncharacterized protein P174DRAFT_118021 [Aspergillus novofumigatus IBT 16806]PKX97838.1 hypothetical protein P174DRAFT_118021 [Aspergillus novofumigatus IBT 16806]